MAAQIVSWCLQCYQIILSASSRKRGWTEYSDGMQELLLAEFVGADRSEVTKSGITSNTQTAANSFIAMMSLEDKINQMLNLKSFNPFVFFFALACEKIFIIFGHGLSVECQECLEEDPNTQKRFKRTIFIRTKHNLKFIKLQNDT